MPEDKKSRGSSSSSVGKKQKSAHMEAYKARLSSQASAEKKTKCITVYLTEETFSFIEAERAQFGESRQNFVHNMIIAGLEQYKA